jgi:hypothetical protein
VNASSAGAPQVTESGLLSYVVPNTTAGLVTANLALPTATGPGFILKSIGPPTITNNTNYTVCQGNPGNTRSFTVNLVQLIPDPFLGVGSAGSSATTAVSQLPGSEVGQYVAGTTVGTANADILNVTLANLPAAATVYVPQTVGPFGTVAGVGGATVSNNFSLTIAGSTLATGAGVPAGTVAFTPSSGSVTIPYTVTVQGGGDQTTVPLVPIDVVVGFAANAATAQGAITANYTYAPTAAALTGPTTTIPTFVASSFTAANGSTIANCQTTLLFPFVTNQIGFDTGLVLANTSVDNLGNAAFTKSAASAQSGTCQLFFYGTTAPTPAGPIADPQGSLASGNVHAFQLSAVASGYQGYMIAVCPFLYGHGYAFLTNAGTSGNAAVAEGYIPEVIGFGDRGQASPGALGDFGITF